LDGFAYANYCAAAGAVAPKSSTDPDHAVKANTKRVTLKAAAGTRSRRKIGLLPLKSKHGKSGDLPGYRQL
jgi:hypothetical protein